MRRPNDEFSVPPLRSELAEDAAIASLSWHFLRRGSRGSRRAAMPSVMPLLAMGPNSEKLSLADGGNYMTKLRRLRCSFCGKNETEVLKLARVLTSAISSSQLRAKS